MTRAKATALAALACVAALASCASDKNEYREFSMLGQALKQKFSGTGKDFELTRPLIDEMQMPLMLAQVPQHDVRATLIPIGVNGAVVTWTAPDGSTLALREGVLVGSRGLSPDLMSAAVPTQALLRGGKPYTRSHYYLGHDDQTERRDFTCSGHAMGATVLEIHDLRFAVDKFSETCTSPTDTFINQYWVEKSGTVRQSRQWVGPTVGFLELQRLDG